MKKLHDGVDHEQLRGKNVLCMVKREERACHEGSDQSVSKQDKLLDKDPEQPKFVPITPPFANQVFSRE